MAIPQILHQWAQALNSSTSNKDYASEFKEAVKNVVRTAQVLAITLSKDNKKLVILGPSDKFKKAVMLVDVFLNHQKQILDLDQST